MDDEAAHLMNFMPMPTAYRLVLTYTTAGTVMPDPRDAEIARLAAAYLSKEAAIEDLSEMNARLRAEVEALRTALEDVLAHDFAEECQECGIGRYEPWARAKKLVASKST